MTTAIKPPCDEGVNRSKKCAAPWNRNVGRWVLPATILGSSIALIDGTVVNVALPVLQEALNATFTDVQWIVASYALFLAALILVGGSLGDRFGRCRIFAYGIALFALSSVWFGFSPNRNSRAPMMPLSLFKSCTFSGANLLTLLLYSALGGAFYFFLFNLIQVQGCSATAAGAAFLPFILLRFVLSRESDGLVSRYGAKLLLVIGPAIASIGFVLFAISEINGSYWTTFFPAIIVLGLAMAISVAPLKTTVMGAVMREVGVASAINNAFSHTAGLLSIAVLNIFVLNAFNRSLNWRLVALNISPQAQQLLAPERIKLAGAEVPPGLSNDISANIKQVIALSFLDGFRLVMWIAVSLALTFWDHQFIKD